MFISLLAPAIWIASMALIAKRYYKNPWGKRLYDVLVTEFPGVVGLPEFLSTIFW